MYLINITRSRLQQASARGARAALARTFACKLLIIEAPSLLAATTLEITVVRLAYKCIHKINLYFLILLTYSYIQFIVE